jgi:hypothetical protein
MQVRNPDVPWWPNSLTGKLDAPANKNQGLAAYMTHSGIIAIDCAALCITTEASCLPRIATGLEHAALESPFLNQEPST